MKIFVMLSISRQIPKGACRRCVVPGSAVREAVAVLSAGERLELGAEGQRSLDFGALLRGEPGTCWQPARQPNRPRP